MGWFGGLFGGSGASNGSGSDPLAKLDPKLREFLAKESPLKYQSTTEAEKKQEQHDSQAQSQQALQQAQSQTESQPGGRAVPPESLYQDGRYADIWKTYRPLAAIEADTKTDHERLMDVLDAYKDRRAQIGRAALENCAVEQTDWNACIKDGPLSSRMTFCHEEMRKFERCYNVQSRLLKGLGYLSAHNRSPEIDEQIQLHADTLFQRMLQQEAAIEKAKAEGLPVPKLDMSGSFAMPTAAPGPAMATVTASSAAENTAVATKEISEEMRKQWDEKLSKLPEAERPSEEAALRAELQAHNELAVRVHELRAVQAAEREQRKAEGKATIKDRVTGFLGK